MKRSLTSMALIALLSTPAMAKAASYTLACNVSKNGKVIFQKQQSHFAEDIDSQVELVGGISENSKGTMNEPQIMLSLSRHDFSVLAAVKIPQAQPGFLPSVVTDIGNDEYELTCLVYPQSL